MARSRNGETSPWHRVPGTPPPAVFPFWILETGLLVYLFGMAGWVMWQTGGAAVDVDKGWQWLSDIREWEDWGTTVFALIMTAIFVLPIGLYWALQACRKHWASFWLVSVLALAPQMPAALSYNQVDWLSFWKYPMFTTEIPQFLAAFLLLASLLLLIGLQRVGDLRRLGAKLAELRLDGSERASVVRNEGLVLGALTVASLLVTAVLLTAGVGFSQLGRPLGESPWPVLSIGVAVVALLAMVIAQWLRRIGSGQAAIPGEPNVPSPTD